MKKLLLFLFIAFVAVNIQSCKILKTPAYSQEVTQMTLTGKNTTDLFYSKVIASENKNYDAYAQDYSIINSQITDILILDSARKNSTSILIIGNDLKNRFVTYEQEHKEAGKLNNRELQAHWNGIKALWSALYNSERNYNKK